MVFTVREAVTSWSSQYHVQGVLSIPYAEIREPFQAWYDADNMKSRIDYYDGKRNCNFLKLPVRVKKFFDRNEMIRVL